MVVLRTGVSQNLLVIDPSRLFFSRIGVLLFAPMIPITVHLSLPLPMMVDARANTIRLCACYTLQQ